MPFRVLRVKLRNSATLLGRAWHYANSDWTRGMLRSRRVLTRSAVLLQGYVVYCALMWAFMVPKALLPYLLVLPKGLPGYLLAFVLYNIGFYVMNGLLTAEFVRKAQLEADQIAARQIQQTLHPQNLEEPQGYTLEMFYKPFRDVGGDYFDVIELPNNRTLFAVADVSGKGVPAALLAANIQALVRSIASVDPDPLVLARRTNQHLTRYTPSDRFATAVFIVLTGDSGELTYVNAGHNAPIVSCSETTTFLEATGVPLGLFADAEYQLGAGVVCPGGALLLFTDGLTDSIPGQNALDRVRAALAENSGRTMATLQSLVDPNLNNDDVTVLLLRRRAACVSRGVSSGSLVQQTA